MGVVLLLVMMWREPYLKLKKLRLQVPIVILVQKRWFALNKKNDVNRSFASDLGGNSTQPFSLKCINQLEANFFGELGRGRLSTDGHRFPSPFIFWVTPHNLSLKPQTLIHTLSLWSLTAGPSPSLISYEIFNLPSLSNKKISFIPPLLLLSPKNRATKFSTWRTFDKPPSTFQELWHQWSYWI